MSEKEREKEEKDAEEEEKKMVHTVKSYTDIQRFKLEKWVLYSVIFANCQKK